MLRPKCQKTFGNIWTIPKDTWDADSLAVQERLRAISVNCVLEKFVAIKLAQRKAAINVSASGAAEVEFVGLTKDA